MQSTKIYDSIKNAMCKSTYRTEVLNNRIAERNIPSRALQPSFSIRPAQTKYTIFPLHDQRTPATVSIIKEPTYEVSEVFNPGTAQAPWSGFATNINTESTLRNQYFALQKSDQAVYVPSSNSDLFNAQMPRASSLIRGFPELNRSEVFCEHNPNKHELGTKIFHNSTRQQLKGKVAS